MTDQKKYEEVFADIYPESTSAFAFWKGRVALYALLRTMEVGPGDEVILPGFTCVVVANAIRFTGAKPIYVDIKPGTYNLDLEAVDAAVNTKTKALIIQHTFGIPANLKDSQWIADQYGLYLIEDCAHALGSSLKGTLLGSVGHGAFFSSQWSKPYTTGLGGVAITRDEAIKVKLREIQESIDPPPLVAWFKLRLQLSMYRRFYSPRLYWRAQSLLHAMSRTGLFVGSSNEEELAGQMPEDYRWRMAKFQASAGVAELAGYAKAIDQRRLMARFYDEALDDNGWETLPRPDGTILLRYPVRVENKEYLLRNARTRRIEMGSWFESPLHPTPLSQHHHFNYELGSCPNGELAAKQVVNLPLHNRMTFRETQRIVDFFLEHAKPVD